MCGCNAETEDTEHFLLHCHFYSVQRFELFNSINKVDLSFTQLDTNEQVNILLNGYQPNKSSSLNQDIKFVINFLKKSSRFDKLLISFNQWFYVWLFFFLPICIFYVTIFFLLENNCKLVAWLQITGYKSLALIHFF